MNFSVIIAGLALVISFITLYFTFFHKSEKVLVSLANCEGFQRCNLNLTIIMINKGNQNISITNCYVLFFDEENNHIEMKEQNISFDPFVLSKNEQKIIKITSPFVPELKANERVPLTIKVNVNYVNSKGCICTDLLNIGNMEVRNRIILKLSTQHLPHKLSSKIAQYERNKVFN